ncbi:MAG: FAD-binding oxidoreductase [Candidatus Liberibacter asiaticus]|uniref:FAD-binding oxidoreductase n=1 Tax=Liberibacter asiaticus TaxID=34021 RepID=UPI0004E0393C|nr:FAD-binding oxidoreductase [Candidatus Liberibacter asiaticus]MDI1493887.1 FAD-binding oxidoreductase [Candidatus Liberibacter asiaticus]QYK84388.1 FAD-binding oxidoreductase [Candidatus Liberibacter asiaticus]WCM58837.1 FAD-binding oxidoreductase [Candidatus Liberibacter asiaticus]BAP26326.1 putative FAD-dependent oxidoreductase protein [Candidatus Liberibacter asiaticus str. Ishi-1]
MNQLSPDLIQRFISIVGSEGILDDQKLISPYLTEERKIYHGTSPLVLLPSCTHEVSQILKLATETNTSITPQGGNTGLVGGQIPRKNRKDIILSIKRMNRIRDIDLRSNTIAVDAGINLFNVQKIAEKNHRLFPLSLPSEKYCHIGGNLATNAGGTAVLSYGNIRHLCLGIEAVLPTGDIWNGMHKLIKDNSRYDIRDLLIGSEGTLGIITGAVLRLLPYRTGKQVAFIAVNSLEQALQLLQLSQKTAGSMLTAFELISNFILKLVVKHIPNTFSPLSDTSPWYILLEISSTETLERAQNIANTILATGFNKKILTEWILPSLDEEKNAIWCLRNNIPLAQKREGRSIKHDISVPIGQIPSFLQEVKKSVSSIFPKTRIGLFGHIGDGNIHFNVFPPTDENQDEFLSLHWNTINNIVYSVVLSYGGSIAAEHGIGQLHKKRLEGILEPTEIKIMKKIKEIFDPAGIMNPGKFL